jgi:hypothetical protein
MAPVFRRITGDEMRLQDFVLIVIWVLSAVKDRHKDKEMKKKDN